MGVYSEEGTPYGSVWKGWSMANETTTQREKSDEKRTERENTMTIAEAQKELRVSKAKIARLIKEGKLPAEPDPLDKRFKLVQRADVEALLAQSQRPAAQQA